MCVCVGLKDEIVYTETKTFLKTLKLLLVVFVVM